MDERLGRFIEGMGLYFESEGLPRIAGRLYAFLLVSEEPRSLHDLTSALRVSKASISSNARLLEQHAMVQLVARPGDRRDYYVAAPDQTRTIEVRLHALRTMDRLLAEGLQAVPPQHHTARTRLTEMISLNAEILRLLGDVLEGRRARRA